MNVRQLMNEAARLTRAGDLRGATAAIQTALGMRSAERAPHGGAGADVIDVEAFEVPQVAPGSFDEPAPESHRAEPRRKDCFVAGDYVNRAGRRDYKLFIPADAGSRPLPLVVLLHGCTQDPDDFAAGTAMNDLARAHGFLVLYPAQSQRLNPKRCWNWFKPNHQQRGRGEPALLAGMTRDVMERHAIDSERVFVAGLSAGGAMAAILGEAYPELYCAVGVHSGLAAGVAADLPSALAAMKDGGAPLRVAPSGVPTIVFHGDADPTVHPSNGDRVIAASAGATTAADIERIEATRGRACTRSVYRTPDGKVVAEHWLIHGGAHAWSGGSAAGSYTDRHGPDASGEMVRFFMQHPRRPRH